MGGTYKEMDGLYYPDIEIEDVSRFCGKYGDMWKKYMMENHHVRYRSLMLDEKLNEITSLEMVVGSLHKNLAISLKEVPLLRERSMYLRFSRERCFWLPGIYLLISAFYCC